MDEYQTGSPEPHANAAPVARAVAILSSREDPETLGRAIDAVLRAGAETDLVVDVVVNGNRALADAMSKTMLARWPVLPDSTLVRLWFVAMPDKAYAWNTYVHEIWPYSGTTFFVDGYAEVVPAAFRAIEHALEENPLALAATGVPSVGRSAASVRAQMLRGGGFHGTLHAMRCSVVERLRATGFRLPVGIYRNDSTLGGVIYLGLDPLRNSRDRRRVTAVAEATWVCAARRWWSLADWRAKLRRSLRQAQGDLEHLAIHDHLTVCRQPPETLPATALELIDGWVASHPEQARKTFVTRPLCWYALRKLRKQARSGDEMAHEPGARLLVALPDNRQT